MRCVVKNSSHRDSNRRFSPVFAIRRVSMSASSVHSADSHLRHANRGARKRACFSFRLEPSEIALSVTWPRQGRLWCKDWPADKRSNEPEGTDMYPIRSRRRFTLCRCPMFSAGRTPAAVDEPNSQKAGSRPGFQHGRARTSSHLFWRVNPYPIRCPELLTTSFPPWIQIASGSSLPFGTNAQVRSNFPAFHHMVSYSV